MRTLRLLCALLLTALAVGGTGVEAQTLTPQSDSLLPGEQPLPTGFEAVGIDERLGEFISPETAFLDSDGRRVTLDDYLGQGRPVVLAFAYHDCPMLCSLILDGFAQALGDTGLTPGEDFEALAVSFDATETPADAAPVKQRYLDLTERPALTEHWHFLTGTEESVDQLTAETGFNFEWDERTQQYAHTAALIFISPDGKITRYLYGIQFPDRDFRNAVVEAGEGTVGTITDRVLLFCYQYDPTTGRYGAVAMNMIRAGGALTVLALGGFWAVMWRRERRAPPRETETNA